MCWQDKMKRAEAEVDRAIQDNVVGLGNVLDEQSRMKVRTIDFRLHEVKNMIGYVLRTYGGD